MKSKLVSVGGVDAGQYGPDCTHVIVHNIVYVIFPLSLSFLVFQFICVDF